MAIDKDDLRDSGKAVAIVARNIKASGDFVVAPGIRSLVNILRAGEMPELIIATKDDWVKKFELMGGNKKLLPADKIRTYKAPGAVMEKSLGVTKSAEIYSLFKKPDIKNECKKNFIVWLNNPDNLRNIGMTVRNLVAVGIKDLILNSEDKNIWHAESVQASCGYLFHMNSVKSFRDEKDALNCALKTKLPLITFSDRGEEVELNKITEGVLIFGNERSGVSQNVMNKSDIIARIPMSANVTSLNLATSVAVASYLIKYPNKP